MRFLQSEYKPIIQAIEAAGLEESDFSFVKKRGKLHINHLAKNRSFHFFRKTETVLNSNLQWEKSVFYKYGKDKGDMTPVENW